MNVKNDLQYLLVIRRLEEVAAAGFLTDEELAVDKRLAVEKYRPSTV